MFKANYKDWPQRHKKLLHATAAVMILLLVLIWFGVYPRWRRLVTLQEEVHAKRQKLERNGIKLDVDALNDHIMECIESVEDRNGAKGLVTISNETIAKATMTFDDDIREAYPAADGASSISLFVGNSTRIDYKDLYDRISSEFKEHDIAISQKSLEPDEDSSEPVFHLMLKLWTLRYLVRAAVQNRLELDKDENGMARIFAMRTTAYTLPGEKKPYLLEFPIVLRFSGTMEDFLPFMKTLQKDNVFLPVKTISISSTPPDDFPPGASREISHLHFRITCSSFFKAPAADDPQTSIGETRQ